MKRQRESPIDYEVKDGVVILNYNLKNYTWTPTNIRSLDRFLNEETYDYTVVHTNRKEAVFHVESLRENKDVLRQSVNLLK